MCLPLDLFRRKKKTFSNKHDLTEPFHLKHKRERKCTLDFFVKKLDIIVNGFNNNKNTFIIKHFIPHDP